MRGTVYGGLISKLICRPTTLLAGASLWMSVLVSPAAAQLENAVEICGDPQAAPRDIVRFCLMALDSGKLDPQVAAQINANLGVGYFELGRFAEAVDAYSAAIAGSPRMVAAYVNRGRAQERLRRPEEALADYSQAIALDPDAADAYLGRGVLLLRQGQAEPAIGDFEAAARAEPDWVAPRFNLGVALLNLGRYAEAEQAFSAVLSKSQEDAAAWMNRGRARAGLGDPEAESDFDRAIRLDPEWGGAWFARGRYFDERGAREAANADFLRAYELGYADPWLIQRVREISG